MKQESFTCDVCGAVKGRTNHWWKMDDDYPTLQIVPWNIEPEGERFLHICGEACATKKLSEFMGRK